jgi:hypothetical protein
VSKQEEREQAVADCPVYWFTLMELGRVYGAFKQADRAMAELARLGILVRYQPPGATARRKRRVPLAGEDNQTFGEHNEHRK